jgi:hypothetical protein
MAAPALVPFRNITPRLFEGLAQAEIDTIVAAAKRGDISQTPLS